MPAGRRASGRDDGMICITGDTHGSLDGLRLSAGGSGPVKKM